MVGCRSQPPRSMPRCSTARRPASSPIPPSTYSSSRDRRTPPCEGFADAGHRRHRPDLDRRGRVPLRPRHEEHGHRLAGVGCPYAHEVAKHYAVNIALHTDHCPKDKLDTFVRPLPRGPAPSGSRGAGPPRFQSHMWDGSAVAARREPVDIAARAPGSLSQPRRRSSSRSRSASSAVRRTASPTAIDENLYSTAEDAIGTIKALGSGRERALPDRPDLRQRARRLQAGQRQAAPGDPLCRPSTPSRTEFGLPTRRALRPRLPRRLGIAARGDRPPRRLRRHQDERRHRHAVRLHARHRRPG